MCLMCLKPSKRFLPLVVPSRSLCPMARSLFRRLNLCMLLLTISHHASSQKHLESGPFVNQLAQWVDLPAKELSLEGPIPAHQVWEGGKRGSVPMALSQNVMNMNTLWADSLPTTLEASEIVTFTNFDITNNLSPRFKPKTPRKRTFCKSVGAIGRPSC